jgi:hypothetical protein
MQLPKEMRLMIYELIFQDILNDTFIPRFRQKKKKRLHKKKVHDPTVNCSAESSRSLERSLALAHTSRAFRAESRDVGEKLVAALTSSIIDGFDEWGLYMLGAGMGTLDATLEAMRQLCELMRIEDLLYQRV